MLDTTPLASHEPVAAGPEKGDAQASEMSPAQVTTDSPEQDAAVDAGIVVVTPPPSTAPAQPIDAGAMPPMASRDADAGKLTQCDAVGSYGLQASLDMAWEATPWFDAGSGNVELYGLVQVDALDAKTHKASATFQLCGLSLPELNSRALCSSYELQVPQNTWDDGKLPRQPLDGTYSCDASQCSLKFSPLSYTAGIELNDPHAPWPALKDTTPTQFPDDDADGFPGVSVDVVSTATFASGQTACSSTSGSTGSRGSGNSGNSGSSGQGNGKKSGENKGPGNQTTTASMPASIGRLLLGMRTQLTAALQLAPDCELRESTGSDAALDLRAGGCLVSAGSDPSSASAQCSEELRSSFDQTLPRYKAVDSKPGPGGKKPGGGTVLKAVRFAPGTQVSCEQVRNSMF